MVAEAIEVRPHAGPQEKWLSSPADIAIYGGAAGGGKSYALLMEPLRHMDNPQFGGTIFRRTYPQITSEGGLWDTAGDLYPQFGGAMLDGKLEAKFPSGMKISFRHLQHESNKHDWQGSQIPFIGFDELNHFTASQFWYLLSRNRSTCGVRPYVRATTNPEAGSWVAELIAWWIDHDTGLPIPERAGLIRWFVRAGEELHWADDPAELRQKWPDLIPKSLTFVPAKLDDNPTLMRKDPGYLANLLALPRLERERLLGGNWLAREDAIIDPEWLRRFAIIDDGKRFQAVIAGDRVQGDFAKCRRFATVDTAGTSKDKANDAKGKPPSWSVCAVWDYHPQHDLLMPRHVWRARVGWNELKVGIPAVLKRWGVRKCYIENAHFGPALKEEIRGVNVELIGPTIPGMRDGTQGAKLDRAVASGLLTRLEHGGFAIPDDGEGDWVREYRSELTAWGGLPEETADQIDVSSYAAYIVRKQSGSWGGVVAAGGLKR